MHLTLNATNYKFRALKKNIEVIVTIMLPTAFTFLLAKSNNTWKSLHDFCRTVLAKQTLAHQWLGKFGLRVNRICNTYPCSYISTELRTSAVSNVEKCAKSGLF